MTVPNEPKLCPTCHQVIRPKGSRICGDCHQMIRRCEKWHVGPDSRIRHNDCPPIPRPDLVSKLPVERQDTAGLFPPAYRPLTITEADPRLLPPSVVTVTTDIDLASARISGRSMTLDEIRELATASYAVSTSQLIVDAEAAEQEAQHAV